MGIPTTYKQHSVVLAFGKRQLVGKVVRTQETRARNTQGRNAWIIDPRCPSGKRPCQGVAIEPLLMARFVCGKWWDNVLSPMMAILTSSPSSVRTPWTKLSNMCLAAFLPGWKESTQGKLWLNQAHLRWYSVGHQSHRFANWCQPIWKKDSVSPICPLNCASSKSAEYDLAISLNRVYMRITPYAASTWAQRATVKVVFMWK